MCLGPTSETKNAHSASSCLHCGSHKGSGLYLDVCAVIPAASSDLVPSSMEEIVRKHISNFIDHILDYLVGLRM